MLFVSCNKYVLFYNKYQKKRVFFDIFHEKIVFFVYFYEIFLILLALLRYYVKIAEEPIFFKWIP